MAEGLLELDPSQDETDHSDRVTGVSVAKVICNLDALGEGRVQVSLPWLPGFEPWARVATLSAGMMRGTYFIPQINDEVLVAFNQGDIRDPFIIGSLWNTLDRPPALLPTDPITKRVIRTPLGHEIEFDDLTQEISITSTAQHSVTLGLTGIDLEAGTLPPPTRSKITLDAFGNITIDAKVSLELNAPIISINGKTVSVKGDANTSIQGGIAVTIKGAQVNIN